MLAGWLANGGRDYLAAHGLDADVLLDQTAARGGGRRTPRPPPGRPVPRAGGARDVLAVTGSPDPAS